MKNTREMLANIRSEYGCKAADDETSRFFNAPAEIDNAGDVWVDGPGRGHWATEDQLKELVEYLDNTLGTRSQELVRDIAASVSGDWEMPETERVTVAALILTCTASLDGLIVNLVASKQTRAKLAEHYDAIRDAAASAIARTPDEYDQIELVLRSRES